jgi:uncharacterized protein (DUF1697 family)
MTQYLAFLRGINVGGKSLIRMAALKEALESDGFTEVKTYIQSGNVFLSTPQADAVKVAQAVTASIAKHFALDVKVVAFTKPQWQEVVASAPKWWNGSKTEGWKHDLLILLPPYDMKQVMLTLGEPAPEVENIGSGAGVIYASLYVAKWSRTRLSKLPGTPLYKQITIRNYNTSTKLLALFD